MSAKGSYTPPPPAVQPPSGGKDELVWTEQQPTEPGWYWMRAPNLTPRIEKFYRLFKWSTECTCSYIIHNSLGVYGEPFEFAGPLPRPKEP